MHQADPIGLGAAPLGGLFATVDDDAARATVDRAWELGVRLFDTAPLYGSGLSEERLGKALQGRPRSEYALSTKVGRLLRPGDPDPIFHGAHPLRPVFDFSGEGMVRSVAESLDRLGLDRVDTLFVHDPDEHIEQALTGLDALRGICRLGVGTNRVETALAFAREGGIDQVMIAGRYTLLDRSAEPELLPLCAERGIAVTAAGVFNSGILAGGETFDYQPASRALRARAAELEALCSRYRVPLAAAALQFPLRHPAVRTIVVGARSAAEIEENLGHLARPIPEEFWFEDVLHPLDDR
ncbi:MAG: D-threo-aldose 1-dehydrogenase [Gaiellales bacterium]|jgi:D-threo-aldose 1-dehydrogenase|nr:D-threo-aldose 1-dehydrogenase [Gaiellaceae bacterium]MDX6568271.1 D-threo-aldose 1-dehydrogenase [Gaiellales bacterium]